MKKQNIYNYYMFGYNYYVLRYRSEGMEIKILIRTMKELFDYLEDLELNVTKTAAKDLSGILKEIGKKDLKEKVSSRLAMEITRAINKIDVTLDSELQLREAYIITEKRFEIDRLLNKVEKLFAEGVFEKIPPLAQYDFGEVGECIAFLLPTAAAFHMLRATEGIIKMYYLATIKRRRIKKLMWGDMVNHLRERKRAPKTLLDSLDNIRENYRNPTQHPEARYNIDEAQDLFSVCIEAVNKIIKNLGNNK